MEDVDSVTVVDGIGECNPIDDQIVVEEDRDVLADGSEIVEHVTADRGLLGEIGIEHPTDRAPGDVPIGTIDVTSKRFGERDPHHRTEH